MSRPRKDQQLDIPGQAIRETIRLLDERDAQVITLADVAAAVGCRAPALYAYFAGKDALLIAVHNEGFRILLQEKLAVANKNASDPLNQLCEGGLTYLRFAFERPGLYRLMFSPPLVKGLSSDPFATDPGAECLTILRSAVTACQKKGYLSGMDAAHIAFVLWSAVHGAASLLLQGRAPAQTKPDTKAAASVVNSIMSFIQLTRAEKTDDI
ncbi:TetR family transcriptional regulator [Brenneria roseae subsp. americana]|uniref:TetR family transcriptional regulator n=1 Tax=Brenneria roseae subsp. americana TaxID=1508507 RepID=A0A2U1TZN5_9GAMM|nr:TetR/AcrR family transcriptional regulator [Brenneria roseae]PWC14875.1 TetR family transcriptional regulator [Brenneria roseae subsp. americana]